MNHTELVTAAAELGKETFVAATFPLRLHELYNKRPLASVTLKKLRDGTTNPAHADGGLVIKKKIYVQPIESSADPATFGDSLRSHPYVAKHKPRFLFVTNGTDVHLRDFVKDTVWDGRLDDETGWPYQLAPLAGFEAKEHQSESPADLKAANHLKKLYEALLAANKGTQWVTGVQTHELNVLMTRLLFCFYAEDTGIFENAQIFTKTITAYAPEQDGSTLAPLLARLFKVMNVDPKNRASKMPPDEAPFPYVNGNLFEKDIPLPAFDRTARRALLDCGNLNWTSINPDIFGSMIQTIADSSQRSSTGMHYTSVPNIMKVLKPLLLDDLNQTFDAAKDTVRKLELLLERLSKIRIFDPACGSGNFLIIAYKKLRELEIQILVRISELQPNAPLQLSRVSLENFFGIDIVDFACETAKLSLWIAQHQENTKFRTQFGNAKPTLPLDKINTIHWTNALRIEWMEICPNTDAETYICGNPPYGGSKYQTQDQKTDLSLAFQGISSSFLTLDYVCAWFVKAAKYIEQSTCVTAALVSTNSICQGGQVPVLWPALLSGGVEIAFAYTSFAWSNNASRNAGITCIIVGLKRVSNNNKSLYIGDHVAQVSHIGPYLTPSATDQIVLPRSTPLGDLPRMVRGNTLYDDGYLTLTADERLSLLAAAPEASRFLRRLYGSKEFLHDIERWILWLTDADVTDARRIRAISDRLDAIAKARTNSTDATARILASRPHRTRDTRVGAAILVPKVSSERRRYLQIGHVGRDAILNNLAFGAYDAPRYLVAILSSRLHYLWTAALGGRMRTDITYSNTLVYNTFPVPDLSEAQKHELGNLSKSILTERQRHIGKTVAWLYDPDTMPANLREAHEANDVYIEEQIYGRKFRSDTQRLELLFAMYDRIKIGVDSPSLLTAKNSA